MKRFFLLLLVMPLAAVAEPSGSGPAPYIDTAEAVLALSLEEAYEQRPISLRGVVTAVPQTWEGRFFMQDDTAGVFVDNVSGRTPEPGDLVHVLGVSQPGGYAPIVSNPQWVVVGQAPLPPARPVTIEELMSGTMDSQRIEVKGVVRDAFKDDYSAILYLVAGAYRFEAHVPAGTIDGVEDYIGKEVLVRGSAGTTFNSQTRQLISIQVSVPHGRDVEVVRGLPGDPYLSPVIPLGNVANYHHGQDPRRRIHVRGRVVHHQPGKDIFLQDGSGGLQVRSRAGPDVQPGDMVEAVGFLDFENHLPVMNDAQYRKLPGEPRLPEAKRVDLESFTAGWHHADYVTLEGVLLDRSMVPSGTGSEGEEQFQLVWIVQTPEFLFTAEGPITDRATELDSIRLGSRVEFSGVSLLRIRTASWNDVGTMESLRLLVPGPEHVRILEMASWLTPDRLRLILLATSILCFLALFWSLTVVRKNSVLRRLVREKDAAQQELQKAHDELDQRVAERTEQLKVEMQERKESEVRFKATLAERTRLAQELHDTVEQSLTGISLHLDAASQQLKQGGAKSLRPLDVARNLMSRSQLELRRSIWDLHSRELEEFDLPGALKVSAGEILEGTPARLDFSVEGRPSPLSEITEENLLRIGREALTNVVRHACASRVQLRLEYDSRGVVLRVVDDGLGFDPENCLGSSDGHFGLSGMGERSRRIGGALQVISAPGEGTRIELQVPMQPPGEEENAKREGQVQ